MLKRGVGLTGPVLAVLAVALSAGATYLFVRFVVVRQWARYASLATVAFLLLFLFASPVTDILRGDAVTASGSTVGDPARVVMLVLDELPLASLVDEDGSIDASLYPNIAELAAGLELVPQRDGGVAQHLARGPVDRDGDVPDRGRTGRPRPPRLDLHDARRVVRDGRDRVDHPPLPDQRL